MNTTVDHTMLEAINRRVSGADMDRFLREEDGQTAYSPWALATLIAEIVAEETAKSASANSDGEKWFALAADVVLFSRGNKGGLKVLLIKRGDDPDDPFAGCWALPGGCVEIDDHETFEQAARRELAEETGLIAPAVLLPVGHYDDPKRDPRGRVISMAFTGYLRHLIEPTAGDDAAAAQWVLVDELNFDELAFDHADILRAALAVYPNFPVHAEILRDALAASPHLPEER